MGSLARRRVAQAPTPMTRRQAEQSLQQRARSWLGTTAITWPIWALTGARTGLPHVIANHHHVDASLGIWPALLMIGGLVDIARMARRVYVQPLVDANGAEDAI